MIEIKNKITKSYNEISLDEVKEKFNEVYDTYINYSLTEVRNRNIESARNYLTNADMIRKLYEKIFYWE